MDNVEMLNQLLENVPREVLFVLRCTYVNISISFLFSHYSRGRTHLRTINKALGAKVNRFEAMGKAAALALYWDARDHWRGML
jgi:hypothetical protein